MNNFLYKLRMKMYHFMQGRYGSDNFNRFLFGTSFIFVILSFFWGRIFWTLALVMLVYGYFRMFSKNHQARYKENNIYMKYFLRVKGFISTMKLRFKLRKTHHIYKCSNCGQNIKIPKGKGRICITCPRCKNEFIKVS